MLRNLTSLIPTTALLATAALIGGCSTMEGLSYDIEDASAYTGQQIAQTGEDFAAWLRGLQEED